MKEKSSVFSVIFGGLVALVSVVPFRYLFYQSFLSAESVVTLQNYYDSFLRTSRWLLLFWRSIAICGLIVLGQLAVPIPAAYCFAKRNFFGKRVLYFLLILLMVLPIQVTLVPNYLVLDRLNLLNTTAALILPSVFSPLGTFILTLAFQSVPNVVEEAALLDGCGTLRCITSLAVPMNPGGMICVGLLSFLDTWNLVEQPIAFLNDFADYPLSVALAYRPPEEPGVQMVCCVLALLPGLFLFLLFHQSLIDGIVPAEEK